jgi:hypothetical protein
LDSEANCSDKTWQITAEFASGKQLFYRQKPGNFMRYQTAGVDESMPVLTNIILISEGPKPVKCSLSNHEITKLRNARNGSVRLVIYDDTIACLPPLQMAEAENHPQTRGEYIQFLHNEKDKAIKWTQDVLNAR